MKAKNNGDNVQIGEAVKHCQAELSQAVVNSLTDKRDEVTGFVQDKVGTVKQKAQHVTGQLLTKKDEAVYKIDRRVNAYNNKLETMVRHWPGQVDRVVHRYPWIVLLTVLSIGMILGFLLSPSRSYRR